jgi:hypothetical protein
MIIVGMQMMLKLKQNNIMKKKEYEAFKDIKNRMLNNQQTTFAERNIVRIIEKKKTKSKSLK